MKRYLLLEAVVEKAKMSTLRALILLQVCIVAVFCAPSISPRVSHGRKAKAINWPSQVLITNEDRNVICGGSIISERWVLTIAHCVRYELGPIRNRILLMGAQNRRIKEPNQVIRKLKKVIKFPLYRTQNRSHDLALIEMDKPIDFTKHTNLKPMCLDLCGIDMRGKTCYATGFGCYRHNYAYYPDELQQLKMKPFDHKKCQEIHRVYYEEDSSEEEVKDLQFCMVSTAEPKSKIDNSYGGVCAGDEGGPLQCQVGNTYFQTGAAWSFTDCETEPGVFQHLVKYADFIKKHTKYELPKHCPKNPMCQE